MPPLLCTGLLLLVLGTSQEEAGRVGRLRAELESLSKTIHLLVPSSYWTERESAEFAALCERSGGALVVVELFDCSAPLYRDEHRLDDEAAGWAAQADEVRAAMPLGDASHVDRIVRGLQSAGFAKPVVLMEPDEQGHMALRMRSILPSLRAVRNLERPVDHDRLLLEDGEAIAGTVRTASLEMSTPYAASIEIPSARIAAMFRGEDGQFSVYTVNGNLVIGTVASEDLEIALPDGTLDSVGLEQVRNILFALRKGELAGVPRTDVLTLARGDVLTGRVENRAVRLVHDEDELDLESDLLEPAQILRHEYGHDVMVTMKHSVDRHFTDIRSGFLDRDVLELSLDLGPSVAIPRDQLDRLVFQRGYQDLVGPGGAIAFDGANLRVRTWDGGKTNLVDGLGIELIRVAPASFAIGWPGGQNAEPVHTVKITRPYYLGATEVTQAQWRALMTDNPSKVQGDDLPVTDVTWVEAQEFCRRLTEREHSSGRLSEDRIYRLPTEAEWELACRAGSSGVLAGRLPEMAWYASTTWVPEEPYGSPHRVAAKMPNAWGFYDMYGNVQEYCADVFAPYSPEATVDPQGPLPPERGTGDESRVLRGGSWLCPADCCTSAARQVCGIESGSSIDGFRVARVFR